MNDMNALEIARRLAELMQTKEACQAYTLAIADTEDPEILLEAALYILENNGNYQVSYDTFLQLYQLPDYQETAYRILTEAFYTPNEKKLKRQYKKNCKLLQKYPYLFRKDFPKFEDLSIRFYPFDDSVYVPFIVRSQRFDPKVNFTNPQITHYFFKDLSKPVLAENIFSQYELEYLYDNVRASEYVAKENHIYLHYADWNEFCSHLQVLNVQNILGHEKIVFLIESEISRYPIDFKKEYGIDYTQYPLKPVGIREINRLILHTQLNAHNGGDFFNEIFFGHPNLLTMSSVILDQMDIKMKLIYKTLQKNPDAWREYMGNKNVSHITKKDAFILCYLTENNVVSRPDPTSRIVPAIFFQPHFSGIMFDAHIAPDSRHSTILSSSEMDQLCNWPVFKSFKYIKTFTPIRRPTTSYAATVRWMVNRIKDEDAGKIIPDYIDICILNRSYMVDPENAIFKDSCLVRFEDAKLNPKATFTALAGALDLPYTESMTYCSNQYGINKPSIEGNYISFDQRPVYVTYDEYTSDSDRAYMEFFMRDVYLYCNYDFHYFKNENVDQNWLKEKINHFKIWDWIDWSYNEAMKVKTGHGIFSTNTKTEKTQSELQDDFIKQGSSEGISDAKKKALNCALQLLNGLYFVSKNHKALQFIPLLELDPELLEAPLYH